MYDSDDFKAFFLILILIVVVLQSLLEFFITAMLILIPIALLLGIVYGIYYVYTQHYPELVHKKKVKELENQIELRKLELESNRLLDHKQNEIVDRFIENDILRLEHEKVTLLAQKGTVVLEGKMKEQDFYQKQIETQTKLNDLRLQHATTFKTLLDHQEQFRLQQAQNTFHIKQLQLDYTSNEYQVRLRQAEVEAEIEHIPIKKYLEIIRLNEAHRHKTEAEKYSILIDKRRLLLQEIQAVISEIQISANMQGVNDAKNRILSGLKSELLDTNILIDLYEKE